MNQFPQIKEYVQTIKNHIITANKKIKINHKMTCLTMSFLALAFATIVRAADQPSVSPAKSDALQKDTIHLHNDGGLS
jgi:hypothetical protein